jgi:hypothetical protein
MATVFVIIKATQQNVVKYKTDEVGNAQKTFSQRKTGITTFRPHF